MPTTPKCIRAKSCDLTMGHALALFLYIFHKKKKSLRRRTEKILAFPFKERLGSRGSRIKANLLYIVWWCKKVLSGCYMLLLACGCMVGHGKFSLLSCLFFVWAFRVYSKRCVVHVRESRVTDCECFCWGERGDCGH